MDRSQKVKFLEWRLAMGWEEKDESEVRGNGVGGYDGEGVRKWEKGEMLGKLWRKA